MRRFGAVLLMFIMLLAPYVQSPAVVAHEDRGTTIYSLPMGEYVIFDDDFHDKSYSNNVWDFSTYEGGQYHGEVEARLALGGDYAFLKTYVQYYDNPGTLTLKARMYNELDDKIPLDGKVIKITVPYQIAFDHGTDDPITAADVDWVLYFYDSSGASVGVAQTLTFDVLDQENTYEGSHTMEITIDTRDGTITDNYGHHASLPSGAASFRLKIELVLSVRTNANEVDFRMYVYEVKVTGSNPGELGYALDAGMKYIAAAYPVNPLFPPGRDAERSSAERDFGIFHISVELLSAEQTYTLRDGIWMNDYLPLDSERTMVAIVDFASPEGPIGEIKVDFDTGSVQFDWVDWGETTGEMYIDIDKSANTVKIVKYDSDSGTSQVVASDSLPSGATKFKFTISLAGPAYISGGVYILYKTQQTPSELVLSSVYSFDAISTQDSSPDVYLDYEQGGELLAFVQSGNVYITTVPISLPSSDVLYVDIYNIKPILANHVSVDLLFGGAGTVSVGQVSNTEDYVLRFAFDTSSGTFKVYKLTYMTGSGDYSLVYSGSIPSGATAVQIKLTSPTTDIEWSGILAYKGTPPFPPIIRSVYFYDNTNTQLSDGDTITPNTNIRVKFEPVDELEIESLVFEMYHGPLDPGSPDEVFHAEFTWDGSSWTVAPSGTGWQVSGDPSTKEFTVHVSKYAFATQEPEWEYSLTIKTFYGETTVDSQTPGASYLFVMAVYVEVSVQTSSVSFTLPAGSQSSSKTISYSIDANCHDVYVHAEATGFNNGIKVYASKDNSNWIDVTNSEKNVAQYSAPSPYDILRHKDTSMYVRVYVPSTVSPGTYTGSLTIKAIG